MLRPPRRWRGFIPVRRVFFLQRLLAPDDGLARERARISASQATGKTRSIAGTGYRPLNPFPPAHQDKQVEKKIIIYFNILDKSVVSIGLALRQQAFRKHK